MPSENYMHRDDEENWVVILINLCRSQQFVSVIIANLFDELYELLDVYLYEFFCNILYLYRNTFIEKILGTFRR